MAEWLKSVSLGLFPFHSSSSLAHESMGLEPPSGQPPCGHLAPSGVGTSRSAAPLAVLGPGIYICPQISTLGVPCDLLPELKCPICLECSSGFRVAVTNAETVCSAWLSAPLLGHPLLLSLCSLGDPDLEAQLGRCCFPGPVLTPAAFQPPLGSQNIPSRPEFSALRHVCSSVCHSPCCPCLSILGDQESWWWLYPSPVWSKAASGRCSFGRRYLLRLPECGWGFMCCLLGTKTSRSRLEGLQISTYIWQSPLSAPWRRGQVSRGLKCLCVGVSEYAGQPGFLNRTGAPAVTGVFRWLCIWCCMRKCLYLGIYIKYCALLQMPGHLWAQLPGSASCCAVQ